MKALKKLTGIIIEYLEELAEYKDVASEQFEYGEKTAYVEVLEMFQEIGNAKELGIDFNIEEKFPL